MLDIVKRELSRTEVQAKLISIEHLEDIRQDMLELQRTEKLHRLQKWQADELAVLTVPRKPFPVRSILVLAIPTYAWVETEFTYQGETIPVQTPSIPSDKENSLSHIQIRLEWLLSTKGYHICWEPRLPAKRIAVRCGLAEYGRNNLAYCKGMGSFFQLALFFSDLPPAHDEWREVRLAEVCEYCQACVHACPTKAIEAGRFLLNNERCLSYWNDHQNQQDFPEWIPETAHNSVHNCLICQKVCPMDQPYRGNVAPREVFSEEETRSLLDGPPYSQELIRRTENLGWKEYLATPALPRNLKAVFRAHQCRNMRQYSLVR